MTQLLCLPNPCSTCPYRRDTPPGIWAREEYDKLPAWDDERNLAGTFLCHQGNRQALCRGWMEVHHRNFAVRMAVLSCSPPAGGWKPCDVALYDSGAQARAVGLKGLCKPGKKAREAIAKLAKKRGSKPPP